MRTTVISLVFMFLLTACSSSDDYLPDDRIDKVLLVYMAGDNNLSDETNQKIESIRQGWNGNRNTKILIYQDAADVKPALMEVSDNKILKLIENYEEENSADYRVLARVIKKCKSLYPSADFNFLVFSHASGWLPDNTLAEPRSSANRTRSIFVDNDSRMELKDFAAAIPDHSFKYIVFEMCFMAGIESSFELKNKADYLLVSSAEILSPGFTEVYRDHVNELTEGSPFVFMKSAFDYFNRQNGYMQSATFSMIKTSELEALAQFIKDNADQNTSVDAKQVQFFDRAEHHLVFDFEDHYSQMLQKEDQKKKLSKLISNSVVSKLCAKNARIRKTA